MSPCVLIADDNADLCWLMAGILRRAGFDVDVCQDADVGMARIRDTDYDAIIIESSPVAGFRPLLDDLAGRDRMLDVVVATTEPDDSATAEWMTRGAFGVLHKPLTADGFRIAISACTTSHEARLRP